MGRASTIPRGAVAGAAPVRRYQPMIPVALALIGGVLAAEYVGGHVLLWCALAVVSAAAWGLLYVLGRRDPWLLVALLALVAGAGAARHHSCASPPPHDVARLVAGGQRLVTLDGVVIRSARQSQPPTNVFLPSIPYYVRSHLVLDCRSANIGGHDVPVSGEVSVTIREPLPKDARRLPALGDRVRIVGLLRPLAPPMNPGTFDVSAYLRRQGIRAMLQTDHWEAVRVTEPAADKLLAAAGAVQRWALARLDRMPSEKGRAVVSAVMFGRRDLLAAETGLEGGPDIEQAFILSGTADFMAVSGLHVAIVAALVLLPARLLGLGPRLTAVLVSAVVLAYAMMTDLSPSVLRAAILIWVLGLGWVLGRRPLILNSLAVSVVIILLARPADLFTASFQLSYGGVLGLVLLAQRLRSSLFRRDDLLDAPRASLSRWRFLYKWAGDTAFLSLAASLVTVPVIAHQFHLVTWLSPVTSIVLFPLVCGLLATSALLVSVGWVAPSAGTLLAILPDVFGRGTAAVVEAAARLPGGHVYVPGFSLGWLLVFYGLLAAWVWRERLRLTRRRLAMAALAAATVLVWTAGPQAPLGLRATFLSVGSGNSTLLELPDGHVFLYDAGSALSRARAAESAIAPALWSRGLTRIDAVFLSHAHFDHFKDILPLADRFRLGRVFVPPTFLRSRLRSDDAVIEALLARGIRVEYLSGGDRLAGTGGSEVRALWPRGPRSMGKVTNEGSLVLAIVDHGRGLLLTGDIEAEGLGALAGAQRDLRADVMLWPHHGANPDAVGRFVRAAGVRTVVLSAGRSWPLRPAPAWAAEEGVALYHTAEDGAVTVEFGPEAVRVETFCPREAPALRPEDDDVPLDPDHEVIGMDDLIVRPFAEDPGELARLEALDLIKVLR